LTPCYLRRHRARYLPAAWRNSSGRAAAPRPTKAREHARANRNFVITSSSPSNSGKTSAMRAGTPVVQGLCVLSLAFFDQLVHKLIGGRMLERKGFESSFPVLAIFAANRSIVTANDCGEFIYTRKEKKRPGLAALLVQFISNLKKFPWVASV